MNIDYIGTQLSFDNRERLDELNQSLTPPLLREKEPYEIIKDVEEVQEVQNSQKNLENSENRLDVFNNESIKFATPADNTQLAHTMGYHIAQNMPSHDIVKLQSNI